MTTERSTSLNNAATGFLTAVLIGLGAWPADAGAAARARHRGIQASTEQRSAAVVPVTITRGDTGEIPSTGV